MRLLTGQCRNALKIMMLAAVLVVGLRESWVTSSQPPVSNEQRFWIPNPCMIGSSDLDVRDEMNRMISDPTAKEELRTLFVFGLYVLFAESEISLNTQAKQILERVSTLLDHVLKPLVNFFSRPITSGLPASLRRFFDKLLLTALAWMLTLACLWRSFSLRLVLVPCRKDPPLILRC